jgi:hypothetical protein
MIYKQIIKIKKMKWYKTLDIHAKINAKDCFELLCGVRFGDLGCVFTFKERIEILHNKIQLEGFIV